MAGFRTARERRLWLLAGTLVGAIYGSAYFVQLLLDPLRSRGLLGVVVWIIVGVAAAAALVFVARQRPRGWELALLAATAGAYLLMLRHLDIIQERLHLVEYGLLGALVYFALRERWPSRRRRSALAAILIALAAGWGDELVQALLPNRHYDLRDVATNAEAAAIMVLALAARARLRASDVTADSALAAAPQAAAPLSAIE